MARAVIASTKRGFVVLLDRLTGKPLFPVEERKVPASTVPGEHASPTQPFPTRPAPLHPLTLSRDALWGLTFWDKGKCRDAFDALDYQGVFRSEERRVGKEGVRKGRSGWSPVQYKKKDNKN